jgi:hypothetical protein
MATDPASPVSLIEGIGPAHAEALASIHVFHVFDLLRCSVAQLHAAVKSRASEDQVLAWQSMASLLQVKGMTAQWAEALCRGGIGTINELASQELEGLQATFQRALNNHLLRDLPTANQLAAMMRDAAIISCCGTLTLTLRDQAGNPISGAKARIGVHSGQTDAHGRVRLTRLPMGVGLPLIVEHNRFAVLAISNPPICADNQAIGVHVLTLPEADKAGVDEPMQLSEYKGDILPLGKGKPIRIALASQKEIREEDLLCVSSFYKRTADVKLVSLLKDYVLGEVIVHAYRVPRAAFAMPPKLGDAYIYRGGYFIPRKHTVDSINRYKRRRAMAEAFAMAPTPVTSDDKLLDLEKRIHWLETHAGLYGHARWTK